MTERFTVDYDVTTGNYDIHDKNESDGVDGYIAYLSDEEQSYLICDKLNEQEETIQELKARNKRQYERLKELTELMYEKQWGKLENMVEEWEKQEELLQAEWGDKQ